MNANLFTEEMVRNVVLTWYHGTNEHLPTVDLERLLADDVEMSYPNRSVPFVRLQAFRDWYADVLQTYFDETHEVEHWEISLSGDGLAASAAVIVRWEARRWKTGDARSNYEAHLSRQRFELARSPEDGRAVIRKKIVETFESTSPLYAVGQ